MASGRGRSLSQRAGVGEVQHRAKSVFDFEAPCDGMVIRLLHLEGDVVRLSEPIMEIGSRPRDGTMDSAGRLQRRVFRAAKPGSGRPARGTNRAARRSSASAVICRGGWSPMPS